MYGQTDIYDSPQAAFGGIFAEDADLYGAHDFDDFGADDEEDDDYGFLGIALTKKARQKKWNKRLARTLGKLKKLHEQGKLDKARRKAKKLDKIVTKLEKVEDGFEPDPEVVAWMDFAQGGAIEDLEQALSAVTWTGEEAPTAPGPEDGAFRIEAPETGLVPSHATGIRGGRGLIGPGQAAYMPGRRRLPPGFRPAGYARWRRRRKMKWLAGHPNAARGRHPADPRARGRGRGLGRRGRRPARPAGIRRRARRAGRRAAVQPGQRRLKAFRAGRRAARSRAPGIGAPRVSALSRGRFGALEEALEETAEEMGFIPGTIGAESFNNLTPSGLQRADLLESNAIDDLLDAEDMFGADDEDDEFGFDEDDEFGFDEDDEFGFDEDDNGTTSQAIRNQGPQFGAVFKRKTEKRLESARKKYNRLRDRAVTKEDWLEVESALNKYRKLAHAYKKAAVAPTPVAKERALADLEQQPLFHSSAVARFQQAGGSIGDLPLMPGDDMLALAEEEDLWSTYDEGDEI